MSYVPLTAEALEAALREIGAARYHDRHPFHRKLHGGELGRGQVQAWALNRFYYQSRIPAKDASLIARFADPAERREWRRRLTDHDGDAADAGGIERWLRLCEGVGLDRRQAVAGDGILPATRFAVDAYVNFVRERTILEAVASSLTELFAPTIIAERLAGMLGAYPWIDRAALAYFDARLGQAPVDSAWALAYVKEKAKTSAEQRSAMAALEFKCDVLWAQLDALHHAYVEPATPPPGAFRPEPCPR